MQIDFDPAKRNWTLESRGLDMARAREIFEGVNYAVEDDRRDYGEPRWITIGFLDDRMVVMVWTQRGETCRIISLRKANAREQAFHGPRLNSRFDRPR